MYTRTFLHRSVLKQHSRVSGTEYVHVAIDHEKKVADNTPTERGARRVAISSARVLIQYRYLGGDLQEGREQVQCWVVVRRLHQFLVRLLVASIVRGVVVVNDL